MDMSRVWWNVPPTAAESVERIRAARDASSQDSKDLALVMLEELLETSNARQRNWGRVLRAYATDVQRAQGRKQNENEWASILANRIKLLKQDKKDGN